MLTGVPDSPVRDQQLEDARGPNEVDIYPDGEAGGALEQLDAQP